MHIPNIDDTFWAPTRVRQPFPTGATFLAAPVVAYHSLNGALHAMCGLQQTSACSPDSWTVSALSAYGRVYCMDRCSIDTSTEHRCTVLRKHLASSLLAKASVHS